MNRRWIVQGVLVLAVLAVGVMAGFRILTLEPTTGAAEKNGQEEEHSDAHEKGLETHTRISAETAKAQGIETAEAGPAPIRETLTLQGTVEYDVERVRRVTARYPGVIRGLSAHIGDSIKAGNVLARVESDESLQIYAIRAPIDGVVIEQRASAGETANRDEALYVIADLSRVWVDLAVFRSDQASVEVGQSVRVRSLDGALQAKGTIGYIAPISNARSQTSTARIFLDNPDGAWRPGMAVIGDVVVREETVPLAVRNSAIQTFEGADVVFVRKEDRYAPRELDLGRSDSDFSEVLNGLTPGAEYVVKNSYLIKADLTKAGAEHAH